MSCEIEHARMFARCAPRDRARYRVRRARPCGEIKGVRPRARYHVHQVREKGVDSAPRNCLTGRPPCPLSCSTVPGSAIRPISTGLRVARA
eukprot:1777665-Rhodomonas_salina.2